MLPTDAGSFTTTFLGGITDLGGVLVTTFVKTLTIGFAAGFGTGLSTNGAEGFFILKKLKTPLGAASALGFGMAETLGLFATATGGFFAGAGETFDLIVTVDDVVVFELAGALVVAGVFEVVVLAEVLVVAAVVLLPVMTTVLPTTFDV